MTLVLRLLSFLPFHHHQITDLALKVAQWIVQVALRAGHSAVLVPADVLVPHVCKRYIHIIHFFKN